MFTDAQREYYDEMMRRDRASLIVKDGHLVSVITFFIGDNDAKFLYNHEPWTIVKDNEYGSTLYIDQWLTYKGRSTAKYVHREFTKFLQALRRRFPNIKRAKWIRVDAQFRKHGIKEGVRRYVHCKNIK